MNCRTRQGNSLMVPDPAIARRRGRPWPRRQEFRNAQSGHPVDTASSRPVRTPERRGMEVPIDDPDPRTPPPRRKATNPCGPTFHVGVP